MEIRKLLIIFVEKVASEAVAQASLTMRSFCRFKCEMHIVSMSVVCVEYARFG